MRIYFYGATLKAAEKKGSAFARTVQNHGKKLIGKEINVTRINDPVEADLNCIVKAYKFRAVVEYSIMKTGKG